jgi:hypothetical protein
MIKFEVCGSPITYLNLKFELQARNFGNVCSKDKGQMKQYWFLCMSSRVK